jgi:transcriptional regulator with XRE-family HTH domain
MLLAATLRAARHARGLTQDQLGRLLDPPLHHSLISRYESGLRPPAQTLVQIARILRLNLTVVAADVDLVSQGGIAS